MKATVADVLRVGLERVRKGWIQGTYQHGNGVCAVGGLRHAYALAYTSSPENKAELLHEATIFLANVIEEQYPEFSHTAYPLRRDIVVSWNDWKGRTQEEVIAVYEKALVRAEEAVE